MSKLLFIVSFFLLIFENCQEAKQLPQYNNQQSKGKVTDIVAFYNVENLFDTDDDPKTADEDFMPNSPNKWTVERYNHKLAQLTKVLDSLGSGRLPSLIGLCEIENKRVLEDLLTKANANKTYGIVHYDSPDARGIDVALLYNKQAFTPTQSEPLRVHFDLEPQTTTRDILYVQGNFKGEPLHLFVNHWPSRREGQEKSEPRRMAAAAVARKKIDGIFASDPKAKILLMGDFNDEPQNNSISNGLQAMHPKSKDPINDGMLYDLMLPKQLAGEGSYNHQGDWNALDQFIVSGNLLNASNGIRLNSDDAYIYKQDWILFTNDKGQKLPNKTYGGNKYFGGYSDHLPVYLMLRK